MHGSRIRQLTRRASVAYRVGVMNAKNVRALLMFVGVVAGAALASCDETGPSPIGTHYDDAGPDTAAPPPPPPVADAAGEAGESDAGKDATAPVDSGADTGIADAAADG